MLLPFLSQSPILVFTPNPVEGGCRSSARVPFCPETRTDPPEIGTLEPWHHLLALFPNS